MTAAMNRDHLVIYWYRDSRHSLRGAHMSIYQVDDGRSASDRNSEIKKGDPYYARLAAVFSLMPQAEEFPDGTGIFYLKPEEFAAIMGENDG